MEIPYDDGELLNAATEYVAAKESFPEAHALVRELRTDLMRKAIAYAKSQGWRSPEDVTAFTACGRCRGLVEAWTLDDGDLCRRCQQGA